MITAMIFRKHHCQCSHWLLLFQENNIKVEQVYKEDDARKFEEFNIYETPTIIILKSGFEVLRGGRLDYCEIADRVRKL